MNEEELRKQFGAEYPAAVSILGSRMLLKSEGRFARHYESEAGSTSISRFQDGSASISLEQLRGEWSSWSSSERIEFCNACRGLSEQLDFPDMLRFIMGEFEPISWASIAQLVSRHLPRQEAFDSLVAALGRLEGHTANVTQAIALTKHPNAVSVLGAHLTQLWQHPELWKDASFMNWHAFDAICCINHLLDLGVSAEEFDEKVRSLSNHPCARNRETCLSYLHAHFPWLPAPEVPLWQPN